MSQYILYQINITVDMINKINENYPFKLVPGIYHILYGYDHAIGYWMDFYDYEVDEDIPVVELSSLFHGLTGHKLGMILEIIMPDANSMIKDHIHKAHMDLPF